MFPLTQATLIKNEFMTLIFVCVIFEQALKKECVNCRNYIYIIVEKKIAKYINMKIKNVNWIILIIISLDYT